MRAINWLPFSLKALKLPKLIKSGELSESTFRNLYSLFACSLLSPAVLHVPVCKVLATIRGWPQLIAAAHHLINKTVSHTHGLSSKLKPAVNYDLKNTTGSRDTLYVQNRLKLTLWLPPPQAIRHHKAMCRR